MVSGKTSIILLSWETDDEHCVNKGHLPSIAQEEGISAIHSLFSGSCQHKVELRANVPSQFSTLYVGRDIGWITSPNISQGGGKSSVSQGSGSNAFSFFLFHTFLSASSNSSDCIGRLAAIFLGG